MARARAARPRAPPFIDPPGTRHRPEETLLYQQCARCGGRLKVLASIEERELIERILAHRRERVGEEAMTASLRARAPPQASLL